MAEFDTRIQQKGDTQANFESNNPILLENELVIVKMTDGSIKFKVGDGTSHFNSLEYTDNYLVDDISSLNQNKANLNSPNLIGTPTAPTAVSGTSTTQIATTAFVMAAMSSGGGGTEIVVSETQPSSQSTGSFWYKVI